MAHEYELQHLRERVAALERQMAAVLGQLGHAPEPAGGVDLIPLLREGKEIEAIKVYREHTGVGLAEAKDEIDRLKAQYGL
jgi:ribosomal protein L7/L12